MTLFITQKQKTTNENNKATDSSHDVIDNNTHNNHITNNTKDGTLLLSELNNTLQLEICELKNQLVASQTYSSSS